MLPSFRLDYNLGVSIVSQTGSIEPWNMFTEYTLLRHVSRLRIWSTKGKIDSENTYLERPLRVP